MIVSHDDVRTLITAPAGPCISLFMPTHRLGRETRQDPIRLKNLMRDAETQLRERGIRDTVYGPLLQPLADMVDNAAFWQHQSDGLALFSAPNFFQSYRLPLEFEELIVIGDRFHVKPLLPMWINNGHFYILAISQNDLRLFRCTQHSVNEVELEHVPRSLAEALKMDDPERQLQFFTGTPGANTPGGGRRPAVYYGSGPAGEDTKQDVTRYLKKVDSGLDEEVLRTEQAPLVIASVEYVAAIYREISSYRNILAEGINGNPETLSAEELHKAAWELVEPRFREVQEAAVEMYHQASARDLASSDLRTILPAAYDGRIDSLFVSLTHRQWGSFDPEARTVQLHDEATVGDEDVLDFAAIHTFLNSGTVYAVEPHEIPNAAIAAAVFRY